jgi:hypothetical protein
MVAQISGFEVDHSVGLGLDAATSERIRRVISPQSGETFIAPEFEYFGCHFHRYFVPAA